MPTVTLPIAGGFYKSDSLPISHQECVNCYPNIVQANALSQETLFACPGLEQLVADQGDGDEACRGAHVMNGKAYFVNGANLYRINKVTGADGAITYTADNLGAISGDTRVSMADNGTQLLVLNPGGDGYIFTEDPDTLTTISDSDFTASGNPQAVVFIDGYFLLTTDQKKHIISDLGDGLAYNALDFGSAEADPDEIVAPIVFRNELYICGTQTIEAFQNVGGADYPFVRSGVFVEKGVFAKNSLIKTNDSFMFIGGGENESPAVWLYAGGTAPTKVSTTAIDTVLQGLTDTQLEAVFAWSYAQKGGYFVGFALPDTTLVYDSVSGLWHERKSQIINSVTGYVDTERSRINAVVSAYGKVLVGDSKDGRVGSMDVDVLTEYGANIIRRFSTQPFQNNMASFVVPSLELTCESGVGDSTTTDPMIEMEISRDNRTWSQPLTRRLGKVGEYQQRTIWRRLGRVPRFCTLRFTMSEPVKFVAIQLAANIR